MSPLRNLQITPPAPVVALVFAAWAAIGGAVAAQDTDDLVAGRRATPDQLVETLRNAWFARDFEAYMSLWRLESAEERDGEAAVARDAFSSDETRMTLLTRPRVAEDGSTWSTDVHVFVAAEPRARVESWRLDLERHGRLWAIVGKETRPAIAGLVHLPIRQDAWRVRGVRLRLPDFELRLEDGSLFATPESVGPTALVFVGRARVLFSPGPDAEREQLRQFSGERELDKAVDWAFIRVHPDDFPELVNTRRLEVDPSAGRRRDEAVERWTKRAPRSYVVDADLPGSPWWLYPGSGDALVEFPWGRNRVLTMVVAREEDEDVHLFDRDQRVRICSYRSGDGPGRRGHRDDDAVDVIHHDLRAWFDHYRREIKAVDTLRLRIRAPVSTIRLKLDDDFDVSSVTSGDGRSLLHFRVREQDSLVVSLAPLADRQDEISLTVRYSGRHEPEPVDHDLVQVFPQERLAERFLTVNQPLVYSNRTAWYPHPAEEDYATLDARFDTPARYLAITGGRHLSTQTVEERVITRYRLETPGKYFTTVVGRFEEVDPRRHGDRTMPGFAEPRTRGEMSQALDVAGELLAFFESLFGPCPYPAISLAMAEAATPGGHSPPGLVYLQKRPAFLAARRLREDPASFPNQPDFFLAHELAHQWFGQGVGPASYRDQWLSEAWAQYAAALWAGRRGGGDALVEMLDRMGRWARRHDEDGPIDLGRRLGHLQGDPRIQRAIVYDKGALVLHMLRQLLGDEAFFRGARIYLGRHLFHTATTEDLRAALEEAGGRDLDSYFESWVYDTGVPRLEWASHNRETPEGYQTTVRVRPRGLPGPLPLEIAIRTEEDVHLRRVSLGPEGGAWTLGTSGPVQDVQINEDRGILAEVKEVRRLPAQR